MSCSKCSTLDKRIRSAPATGSTYPSILELAYMVNLEYYCEMKYDCVHKIPDNGDASIKVVQMVDFLEKRYWKVGTRTHNKGFSCTSFLNSPRKQLVIVHRGTENLQQIKADILLALDLITVEVLKQADWHTSQSLLNNALKEENNKFVRNNTTVTVTGHSLGGWLAQICTLLAKYPQYHPTGPRGNFVFGNGKSLDMNQSYSLRCIAFDSPGASTALNRMELVSKTSSLLRGKKRDVENALRSLDITVYLSNTNVVNSCGKQFGTVKRIDVMKDCWFWQKLNPIGSHSMERILAYFIKYGE